ncbi:Putative alpha-1,2-mannosidase [Sphingomonas paucimobilis]|nr:Putative alpha-1,2-mannosidase [Sphingomonas paucimobilis]
MSGLRELTPRVRHLPSIMIGSLTTASILLTTAVSGQSLPSEPSTPVDLASPLVGTAPLDRRDLIGNAPPPGEPVYSGQTSPGARLPHSSVEVAPVNVNIELSYPTGVPTPYHYPNPTMLGFTAGGGATYGGRAKPIFMPIVGDWTVPPAYTSVHYDKARENAAPGYYSVNLDNGTKTELTATRWTGMMRFTFPRTDRASIIINLPRAGGTVEMVGDRTIRGAAQDGQDEDSADGPYFVAMFSRPIRDMGTFRKAPGDRPVWGIGDKDVTADRRKVSGAFAGAYASFATQQGETILVKIAHGHSYAEAERRLAAENPGWDFDRIRASARGAWADLLDRVEVVGGTPQQRRLFYSTLFQSFASPRLIAKAGETLTGPRGTVTVSHDRYSAVPYWDTARNQLSLLELMEPKLLARVMQSELDDAGERGFMNSSFHGDHAVLMYLGAMQRGVPFDYAAAYEALRRNATDPKGPRAYLNEYLARGWISDIVPEGSPSPPYAGGKAGMDKTLEYAWDDHALSVMATRLGRTEDAVMFGPAREQLSQRLRSQDGLSCAAGPRMVAGYLPSIRVSPIIISLARRHRAGRTCGSCPRRVGPARLAGRTRGVRGEAGCVFHHALCAEGDMPRLHRCDRAICAGQPARSACALSLCLGGSALEDTGPGPAHSGGPVWQRCHGQRLSGHGRQGSTSSWYVLSAMGFYPVDPSMPFLCDRQPDFRADQDAAGQWSHAGGGRDQQLRDQPVHPVGDAQRPPLD